MSLAGSVSARRLARHGGALSLGELLNALPAAVEREGDVRRLQAAKDQLAQALSVVERKIEDVERQVVQAKVQELLAADEARLLAAAARPLPAGSQWHLCGGAELEPLLPFTDVIDAAWLLKLADGEVMPERKGVVPPWQLVPTEAKLSLETLRRTTMELALPVAVLSYGWESARHPDPDGALLRRLRPVLAAMVHCCQHGMNPYLPDEKPAAWGIVWECARPPTAHPPHPARAPPPMRARLRPLARALTRASPASLPARRPRAQLHVAAAARPHDGLRARRARRRWQGGPKPRRPHAVPARTLWQGLEGN